jgi:hypothetical protein
MTLVGRRDESGEGPEVNVMFLINRIGPRQPEVGVWRGAWRPVGMG